MQTLYPADPVRLDLRDGELTWVRELCGFDEQAIDGSDTATAVALLERLLVERPAASVGPRDVAGLVAADRDHLLAAVYLRAYGPLVRSTVACDGCGSLFDVEFSLADLLASVGEDATEVTVDQEGDGTFRLADGRRFRMPTGHDEAAVAGRPREEAARELLARSVVRGGGDCDDRALELAMEAVAPLLACELALWCPDCGRAHAADFDLPSFLLTALAQERSELARELDVLATAYGWGLNEILNLPRSRRRAYVALAEGAGARAPWTRT